MHVLKDLSAVVTLSVVSPLRNDDTGWAFDVDESLGSKYPGFLRPTKDYATGGAKFLYEVYIKSNPKYTGNVTTPVLYDKQLNKILTNESSEIIRFLDRAFAPGPQAEVTYNLYPLEVAKAEAVDTFSERVQNALNNGVYKCGLAKSQAAYESAVSQVFETLDELEVQLASQRYLFGNRQMSVADIQLLPTLFRFDDVYNMLFKCSKRRLQSYFHLSEYLRDIYQTGDVAKTVDAVQNKDHYYTTFTRYLQQRKIYIILL